MPTQNIVWYVKDPKKLSDSSILEHTINYGTWEDIQNLIKNWGIGKTKTVFAQTTLKKERILKKGLD